MIVVLGNGFDLQCGLKTTYKDFFENRYKDMAFKKLNKILENNELFNLRKYFDEYDKSIFSVITFWDLVFMYENILKRNDGWSYIEEIISKYLSENLVTINSIRNYKESNKLNYLISLLGYLFESKEMSFTPLAFNQWLLKQLNLLEADFATYVRKEVESNEMYPIKADGLFTRLISNYQDSRTANTIINFNYTKPTFLINLRNLGKSKLSNITNVHGTIDDKVIFGIDEKDISKTGQYIKPSESKYLFTKTARKFNNFERESKFRLPSKIKTIVVYGHSLNEQDYSYFQSIFDTYDIYTSKIKLVFAYSNYDKKKKIKTKLIERTIKLLKEYGKTMANPDHGNNLLHKLLLENRLIVKEV
ncbi:MAG: AbiH family protein [Candidatus Izemoplasma sp.]|nr:AbiH family protein [Candidatus Izemoplasma sp.]